LEPNLSTQLDLLEAKIESEFFYQQSYGKRKQAIDKFISQTSCCHHVGIMMTQENMLDK
jgi:hypothetical protein